MQAADSVVQLSDSAHGCRFSTMEDGKHHFENELRSCDKLPSVLCASFSFSIVQRTMRYTQRSNEHAFRLMVLAELRRLSQAQGADLRSQIAAFHHVHGAIRRGLNAHTCPTSQELDEVLAGAPSRLLVLCSSITTAHLRPDQMNVRCRLWPLLLAVNTTDVLVSFIRRSYYYDPLLTTLPRVLRTDFAPAIYGRLLQGHSSVHLQCRKLQLLPGPV